MIRIIAGLTFLLTLQQVGWIADVPASQFDPPPGPMSVFGSAPPRAALELLELATAVLAALLVLGIRTRTVSILLTLALGTGFGLIYSFGKIENTRSSPSWCRRRWRSRDGGGPCPWTPRAVTTRSTARSSSGRCGCLP